MKTVFITCIIIGFVIRFMALISLKGCFTLGLKKPSKIVTSGIYKYIRHPSYLGSLLILIGTYGLSNILGFAYLAVIFFLSRIMQEEMILEEHYKDEYSTYKQKTGCLLPKFRHNKQEAI